MDTSTLERAVRLLSEYANSGVPDAVSLECAQVCGKLRNALAQPQPSPSAGEVLDDVMVAALATAMKVKLARAREKGRGGWEDASEISVSDLWRMMVEHAHKTNLDMVDVANFAGMIWWRLDHNPGEREELLRALAAPQQPTPEQAALELAAETLEESGGLDIDTRCHDQATQGSAKLSVARYLRSLAGDPEPAP